MNPSFAARLYSLLRSVDSSPATEPGDRLLARSAGRMMEETVEAALECGLSVAEIWQHVADAIHNECVKRGCYPSELPTRRGEHAEVVGELADMGLIHDYVRHLAGVTQGEVEEAAEAKVLKMERARAAGTLNVINGLLYTKRAAARPPST